MSFEHIGDIIPVVIFDVPHVVEIKEMAPGKYLSTWDGRPILYPTLTEPSKLEALIVAVADIAATHVIKERHWRTAGA